MDATILTLFALVYLGMILGGLPGLMLDRTGVALVGAILLVGLGRLSTEQAWSSIDVPTLALLLGLMVVSAQFRLGGFYSRVTRAMAAAAVAPATLLALLVLVSGALSAVLANDIVCLAMAPILVEGCAQRRLHPMPFLLGLACAANVGSAATLIGNPQNMLIGQVLQVSFAGYLWDALPPALLGLAATWAVIAFLYRRRWHADFPVPRIEAPPFNPYQTGKAVVVTLGVMAAFLFAPWPREVVALVAAGLLLCSRKLASRDMLGQVDWQLLVLFIALFIVNHALQASGMLETALAALGDRGIDVHQPATLFLLTTLLSNLVSNVPAVMLLLPSAQGPDAPDNVAAILALSSTLAGNLFIVGSIANIIVVTQAAPLGVPITWRDHARVGVPVTVLTLLIAAAWLWLAG